MIRSGEGLISKFLSFSLLQMFFVFVVGVEILFLPGCVLPGNANNSGPQVRDVPFNARSDTEGPRRRVMVLPFIYDKSENTDRMMRVTDIVRMAMIQELSKTRQFMVIRNEDFAQNWNQFLTSRKEYDLEKVSRLASQWGVSAILEGKIINIHSKKLGDQIGLFRKLRARIDAQIRVRIFNARNGKEILNEVRQASAETYTTQVANSDDGNYAMEDDPELAREGITKAFSFTLGSVIRTLEKLSWEGRVALVSGERIYINAGRISGLEIGDVLKVTEDKDEIFDPENGKFIGAAPGRMKGTIEVTSYFGNDGAIAVIRSGSGFRSSDRVELY